MAGVIPSVRVYTDWTAGTAAVYVSFPLPAPMDLSSLAAQASLRIPHLAANLIVTIAAYNTIGGVRGRFVATALTSPGPADLGAFSTLVLADIYATTVPSWTDPGFDITQVDTLAIVLQSADSVIPAPAKFWWYVDFYELRRTDPITLFSGYISSLEATLDYAADGSLLFSASCRDQRVLTDTTIFSKTYSSQSDQATILDILAITGLSSAIFADTTTVQNLGNVAFDFQRSSVTDALNQIAKATGGAWRIDADQKLYYFNATSALAPAPWELTDNDADIDGATKFAYYLRSYQRDFFTPANKVTVIGKDSSGAPIVATSEDTASQTTYGRVFEQVWNPSYFGTLASIQALADEYIASHKAPLEKCTVEVELINLGGLRVGQFLKITNSQFGWTAKQMRVQRLQATARQGTDQIRYVLDLGDYRPDFITELRRIN